MKTMLLLLAATVLAAPTLASAQYLGQESGYTFITPGEPPTFVNPSYNGGYTEITPGEPPTFINRNFNGLHRYHPRGASDLHQPDDPLGSKRTNIWRR